MFQPLRSYITVILDPKEATTKGGLILPDNFADVFRTGVVRAVGPGRPLENGGREDLGLVPGDRVLISCHTERVSPTRRVVLDNPTILDDTTLVTLCVADDIIGIVEKVRN